MNHCCCNPPKPPVCPGGQIDFFAQYVIQSSPASGSLLPLFPAFEEGGQIHLNGDAEIVLAPGYLYLINYLFLAIPGIDSYMQIVPRINGSLRLFYSCFAPTGSASGNTSAAGSFTTNEAFAEEARLSFQLTYPNTVNNIDLSGAISVTPLIKNSSDIAKNS